MLPELRNVRSQHHGRIKYSNQSVDVPGPSRCEEGADDLTLTRKIRVGRRGRALDPSTCATGELPRRGRGPADYRGDLLEGQVEHVVEHERQPLRRRQSLEHDKEGQSDRVREQRFPFRIVVALAAHYRVRHAETRRLLRTPLSRLQHVQAHPRDDRGQPAAEILDAAGAGNVFHKHFFGSMA